MSLVVEDDLKVFALLGTLWVNITSYFPLLARLDLVAACSSVHLTEEGATNVGCVPFELSIKLELSSPLKKGPYLIGNIIKGNALVPSFRHLFR